MSSDYKLAVPILKMWLTSFYLLITFFLWTNFVLLNSPYFQQWICICANATGICMELCYSINFKKITALYRDLCPNIRFLLLRIRHKNFCFPTYSNCWTFLMQNPGFDFSQAQFTGNCPDPRTFMGGIRNDWQYCCAFISMSWNPDNLLINGTMYCVSPLSPET